jgi:hypothetical protein
MSFDDLQNHTKTAESQGKDIFVKGHVNWVIEPVSETNLVYGEDSANELP